MTERPGQPWGMCAAFGCPMFGTVGSDGQWYCFCHARQSSASNDAITQALRTTLAPIAESTLDIRRHGASFHQAPNAYRTIQKRLIAAGRRDLLFGANGADRSPLRPGVPIVRLWLARLEGELIATCTQIISKRIEPEQAQTSLLEGPAHAAQFVSNALDAIAKSPRVLDEGERDPGTDDE